jgi:lipoprotein-releasing system permease protein
LSFRLAFFLARKNLFESVFNIVLLVGAVAAGVGFQVPNTANQSGYEAELMKEGVTVGNGDVRVRPRDATAFDAADALVQRIAAYPGARAVVPVVLKPGALTTTGPLTGAPVIGVDTAGRFRPFRMTSGEVLSPGDAGGVLVGAPLAERLDIKVGDTVSVRVFLSLGKDVVDDEFGHFTMTVRGLVGGTFGAQESIFLDRAFLTKEAGEPNTASMILVYMDDHAAARALAQRLEEDLPQVRARAWIDDSPYLSSSIRASHALGAVSQAMVVSAVTIPVLALLYIHVLHRRRDIGVLCALGFAPREIFFVFLMQAFVVGILGCLVGCGVGYGLIRYFQMHPVFEWQGFVIRPVLDRRSFIEPVLVVLGASLLAGVYPALRAAKMDPAPVFRGLT